MLSPRGFTFKREKEWLREQFCRPLRGLCVVGRPFSTGWRPWLQTIALRAKKEELCRPLCWLPRVNHQWHWLKGDGLRRGSAERVFELIACPLPTLS